MLGTIQTINSPKQAFRTDIQALRGLAVLLVVLYHAKILTPSAGYLGVDIFFVISGFLITKIIQKELIGGYFSFSGFYYRRLKRLLPAAYVVLVFTILAAPFFISDNELHALRSQVIGALTFTANFVLWGQSGYFDGSADTKPLLHFWSLAVEEQYYLAMPALLFFIPRRFRTAAIVSMIMISAALCIYLTQRDPSAAFYLLPARAWELALGSLGAVLPVDKINSRALSRIRLPALFILLYIPFFPTGAPHPGIDAFLVCAATLLIIFGHNNNIWENNPITRAVARIGDFSYSLYLVHWPVLVFTRAAWLEEVPEYASYIAVAVAIVISWLLYRFVEEPFRQDFVKSPKYLLGGLAIASLFISLLPAMMKMATASDMNFKYIRRHNYGIARTCAFGDKYTFTGKLPDTCRTNSSPKVLIWGDSYAMAWASALLKPLRTVGMEQATMSACDPLLGMARFGPKDDRYNRAFAERCVAFHRKVLDYIRSNENLETIVIAARFQTVLGRNNRILVYTGSGFEERETSRELIAEGIKNTVDAVRSAGKKIIVLAPPPANGLQIGDCLERRAKHQITFGQPESCNLPYDTVKKYRRPTVEMLELAAQRADVDVLNVYDFLCDERSCRTEIDGIHLYIDAGHLTVDGAALIGNRTTLASDILARAR